MQFLKDGVQTVVVSLIHTCIHVCLLSSNNG